jgi:perosamine synthetase
MKGRYDSDLVVKNVVAAIRSIVGNGQVSLHEPSFNGREMLYLGACIDSTQVSSNGYFVEKIESELSDITGARHVIAVVNGTSALHLALLVSGVRPGDEVLMPSLTFVATANAVTYCGAIPHFVDSSEHTLGVDAVRLRDYLDTISIQESGKCINKFTKRVIRALVPMHTFGHLGEIAALVELCEEFHLVLVEDAAEALGSTFRGQHAGTFGLCGTLSFNGNKIITTGGGGAILTNDSSLAMRARHLSKTAKIAHSWEFDHDEIGYNYRMPNINAALGCAQLESLPEKIELKRRLYLLYQKAFESVPGVSVYKEPTDSLSNYWLQAIKLDDDCIELQQKILLQTNSLGIMTRPPWKPMHELAPFEASPRMDLRVASHLYRTLINLPSSPDLIVKS